MATATNDYIDTFKSSITRIHASSGEVVGAGFLVPNQYIITCAHVVAHSLGIPLDTPQAPAISIVLDFPLVAPEQKLTANVVSWMPVQSVSDTTPPKDIDDIAVLKLEDELPEVTKPVRLIPAGNLWGDPIRVFGFPRGYDIGIWASGILRDKLTNGWVSMEDIKVPGFTVEPGFSGAPVWDEKLEGIVGMVVAAERQREGVKAAFMIPTQLMIHVCSKLEQWLIDSPQSTAALSDALPSFRNIKVKTLRKSMRVLYDKYEASYNVLNYILNPSSRISIREEIKSIEHEIIELQDELNSLNT